MTNTKRPLFYVEVKDRWSVCPIEFRSEVEALAQARIQVASGAWRVTVYDCTDSPIGRVVACTTLGSL